MYTATTPPISYRLVCRQHYALLEPISLTIEGPHAGGISWSNETLTITSTRPDCVTFSIRPFDAATHYWNGPSIVADFNDGRIEASLVHDLLWEWAPEIAAANHIPLRRFLRWTNLHLAILWRAYGAKKGRSSLSLRIKTWIAAILCSSLLARLWKCIMRLCSRCSHT